MTSLYRPIFAIALLAGVAASSCGACDSCGTAPATPDAASADLAGEATDNAGADADDTDLEEARTTAERQGDQVAFDRVTKARFMAAELEGLQKEVKGPSGPRVKGDAPPSPDQGKLDGDQIQEVQRVIRRHNSELQSCYERGLKRDPSLQGQVQLTVRIGRGGDPASTTARSSTIGDQVVLECMERQSNAWLFPAPSGGSVTITKSIEFTPEN